MMRYQVSQKQTKPASKFHTCIINRSLSTMVVKTIWRGIDVEARHRLHRALEYTSKMSSSWLSSKKSWKIIWEPSRASQSISHLDIAGYFVYPPTSLCRIRRSQLRVRYPSHSCDYVCLTDLRVWWEIMIIFILSFNKSGCSTKLFIDDHWSSFSRENLS